MFNNYCLYLLIRFRFKFYIQVVFRKISDVKRERELAETRKNEGLDQIGSDHPVRKLISKFRKISQENRAVAQTNTNTSSTAPPTNLFNQSHTSLLSSIPETVVQPPSAEPLEYSPKNDKASPTTSLQLLQPPPSSTSKQRDKLETISERIESQQSQVSQITSVNQSPPLHRPPKSSKWKWLKTDSADIDNNTSAKPLLANVKQSTEPQPQPQSQQKTKNPFDQNFSDEDDQTKQSGGNERKQSIPLSLFIPRSARQTSAKPSDEGTDDQVNPSKTASKYSDYSLSFFFCFVIRNKQKMSILI